MKANDSPIRLGVILLLIAGICGLILGAANLFTKDIIAEKKDAANKAAFAAVLPEGGDVNALEEVVVPEEYAAMITSAFKAGNAGYCLQVVNKGYGGEVVLAVGLNTDGSVSGVKVVSHSESAGLGANAERPEFTDQYVGKNAQLTVTKGEPGNAEIKAITGATITSKCVTGSVNEALKFYEEVLKGGNK